MENISRLRSSVEDQGWTAIDESIWENLHTFKNGLAILAPPLDTVPSPNGNAIYTIIEELAELAPVPCLVLSIWPEGREPQKCSISSRILYCKKPFKPVPIEQLIPYQVKKALWGTGRPELLHYAKRAADLCKLLEIPTIVVEDVPRFGLTLRNKLGSEAKIILHQHCNAPLSHSSRWWRRISKAYNGMVFVAGKTIRDTEKKHGKLDNARVIYNGVDTNHYDPDAWKERAIVLRGKLGIGQDETVVLFAGRVIPGKGCLELVRAFIQAGVRGSRLVIVGDRKASLFGSVDYSEMLERLAQENPKIIHLAGSIPQSEIPAWYQAAELVAVPSIQSEGLPKVVTEALAMGKPVLVSERGGSLELVKPGVNGWLLENPKDINVFSETLQKLLENKQALQNCGLYAYQHNRPELDVRKKSAEFFDFILHVDHYS